MIRSPKNFQRQGVITPWYPRTRAHGMTFGEGPAGYDTRVEFDPEGKVERVTIPPSGFLLASLIEFIDMPTDLVGIVHDKSTWARRGLTVQNTVIEPGWRGYLTIELTNHSAQPIELLRGMPIAQIIFHVLEEPAGGYEGKYQDQARGPQAAIHEPNHERNPI